MNDEHPLQIVSEGSDKRKLQLLVKKMEYRFMLKKSLTILALMAFSVTAIQATDGEKENATSLVAKGCCGRHKERKDQKDEANADLLACCGKRRPKPPVKNEESLSTLAQCGCGKRKRSQEDKEGSLLACNKGRKNRRHKQSSSEDAGLVACGNCKNKDNSNNNLVAA